MILPTKHLQVDQSLLAVGADILSGLPRPRTVTSLWEEIKRDSQIVTFERFTLALSFLYAVGAVDVQDDMLRRLHR
jgi:ABC-3C biological conflict system middle component